VYRYAMSSGTVFALTIVAAIGMGASAWSPTRTAQADAGLGNNHASRRMADGKEWTTSNASIDVDGSYCYAESDVNCRQYGRLYTWQAALRACESLGSGWRLPTDAEWRGLAKRYGGVREDARDGGKDAYTALMSGGRSGFGAVLGGDHDSGGFARLGAHGLYWTASETGAATALFYNFGKGGQSLSRHTAGDKQMAVSVRCVRD
jgi:uncharacterized protein (TIGR02145 family)